MKNISVLCRPFLLAVALSAALPIFAAENITIADFESAGFGAWQVMGDAFGKGPARGAVSGQQTVVGYTGTGLANSYHGGDDTTGTLTSPTFTIERKFITFLIGGGSFTGETCLNLVVDGKDVRTAAGSSLDSSGGEKMIAAVWDVTEFAGREAKIVAVDARKGGWGHVCVDQIVQTDERGGIALAVQPIPPAERTRVVKIEKDFIQLPLLQRENGRKKGVERFTIEADGKVMRFMNLEIATKDQKPDFIYSYDVREFRGREVTFRFKSHDAGVLERLELSDREIIDPNAYTTKHRPQIHFSPRLGWMNDINGSYYHNGLYHVFYQANPTTAGTATGFNMHWGHSVSKDLVHWEEWPIALFPDHTGDCYSGTAVMMRNAVPGLNDGIKLPAPALVWAGTTPFSQHIATTADGGRAWKRFAGNPVLPKQVGGGDRDPKVIWHEESQHYVMVLYVGGPDTYRIFRSKDLVKWEQTSTLPNWYECPEFLPVKSPATGENLWLLYGCYRNNDPTKGDVFNGNSVYQLGKFDGEKFTPVGKIKNAHRGPNFYGALTFVNAPKDRHVMMGWARGSRFPGEDFNQCASLPLEMTMKAINGEDTLCFEPVKEIKKLRGKPLLKLKNVSAKDANEKLAALAKDALLDVTFRVRVTTNATVKMTARDCEFSFNAADGKVILKRGGKQAGSSVVHPGKTLDARLLVDRGLVESFWNNGQAPFAVSSLPTDSGPALALEGSATIEELVVYPLRSIWK